MDDTKLPIISVTEYHNHLNSVLEGMRFALKGEVSGYKLAQGKWVTFDLKDAGSKVNCFTTIYKLPTPLEDGMEIVCYGGPRIYVPYGRYSFNVDMIELVGEGALRKAFELTKKKLESEGLFDPRHKKPLPRFPETIGIITSPEAAAYTDILRILNNRWR
ncbi:MAG: exodeoxyribonuclease VII large subunit, partial [Parcubacteria group bacterium]|nr:exodeoxyribonuclease VII large subunit [Parcubacteria group bacterium]